MHLDTSVYDTPARANMLAKYKDGTMEGVAQYQRMGRSLSEGYTLPIGRTVSTYSLKYCRHEMRSNGGFYSLVEISINSPSS